MRLLYTILGIFFKDEADQKRLISVIIPSFIIQAFSVLVNFSISSFLAHTLGASGYGIFTYVFSVAFLAVSFSSYGLNILAVRETPTYIVTNNLATLKGFIRWACFIIVVSGIILAAVLSVLTFYCHLMPDNAYVIPMLVAAIAIPFYGLLNFYSSILRGMNKIILALLNDSIIKNLLFLIAILALYVIVKQETPIRVVWLNAMAFAAAFVVVFISFKSTSKLKNERSNYTTKAWWTKLGSLFILTGIISLDSKVDVIMLGYLKNSSEVGIYTCANRIAVSLTFFLTTMNFIISPAISRLNVLNEKRRLQQMITKAIRWVAVFSIPVFIVIVLLSKWIMGYVFGKDFEQGQIALIILCSAQLISILFGPVANIIMMTGNEKYNTLFTFCSILITIALNFILIPAMGYNGAAIATACGIVFWNASLFIAAKKKLGISSWIFG